ncbi:MAG: tRNA-dihydrouridine synthase [bacterium]
MAAPKQQSRGDADWNEIAKAVKLRDSMKSQTKILGNGDVASYLDAKNRCAHYHTDGAMIGTGIFQSPWMFNMSPINPSPKERLPYFYTMSNFSRKHGVPREIFIFSKSI